MLKSKKLKSKSIDTTDYVNSTCNNNNNNSNNNKINTNNNGDSSLVDQSNSNTPDLQALNS